MSERRIKKQMQKIELGLAAQRLAEQFGPEQQARERLMQEQSRAAFYANEAFRREQQQLATERPLRQRQLMSATQIAEEQARNYAGQQALRDTEQALRNTAMSGDVDVKNRSAADVLREIAARAKTAESGSDAAKAEADFLHRTMEPRVKAAEQLPDEAKARIAAAQRQVEESLVMEDMRRREQDALLPGRKLEQDIRGLSEVTTYARTAGPLAPVTVDGKKRMDYSGADPQLFLDDQTTGVYRDMLQRAQGGAAATRLPQNLPPGVQRTATELNNPQLANALLTSMPRKRAFSDTLEPGTADRTSDLQNILDSMQANPNLPWGEGPQALRAIQTNPRLFGLYQFDPYNVSPAVFSQALQYVREQAQARNVPQAAPRAYR